VAAAACWPASSSRAAAVGTIHEFPVPAAGGGALAEQSAIAAGPDGNRWFTDPNKSAVGRITPTGAVTEFSVPRVGGALAQPTGIVAGSDGNLWFTDPNKSALGRITPTGGVTEFLVPRVGGGLAQPTGITAGPDGNLWFTAPNSDVVGQIGAGVPSAVTAPPAVIGSEPVVRSRAALQGFPLGRVSVRR